MKPIISRGIGLLSLLLALALCAQPVLVQPQLQSFGGSSLENLRVIKQSADGTEVIFTVDFTYDGVNGPSARILPVIADKKQPKVSSWFGADPVTIGIGHGTISLRVKFFNDDPGVPPQITTDRVRILMLSDVGNSILTQGSFSRTINWGSAGAPPTTAPPPSEVQEQARLQAEAQKAKAAADETARQQAAEAQRLAEEKAKADEAARLQAAADEKARQAAEAKPLAAPTATQDAFVISPTTRTKISNIDVVNRNMDRTEMTISVEYQYSKSDAMPRMGVDLTSTDEPSASSYFSSPVADLGRGNRNLVMFPVRLNPDAARSFQRTTLPTDKIWVYLTDRSGAKSYIFQGTMILVWHLPPAGPTAPVENVPGNSAEIETFKQNDFFGGYITVKYNLTASAGRLHVRVFDSAQPAMADWFAPNDVPVKSGPGLQLVKIGVSPGANSPDVFNANTIEIQLLDDSGTLMASGQKQTPMSWAKPK